jgi:RNA polymerase sigma-70 factor (ECF subfamily)
VSLAREGIESAFEEIVRRHSPRVFRIASRFFRQPAQVEDAAQEVFLKAYTHLSTYQGSGSLEGWLTRLTTNLCLNMLRNAKRQPEPSLSPLTDEEGEWLENQLAAASIDRHHAGERSLVASDLAERVLSELPAEDRLVLMAIDGENLSVAEVAEMTGWTKSKVKVRAFRARRRMRKAVEKLIGR